MAWQNSINVRSHLRGLTDGPDSPLNLVIASRSPLSHLFPDSRSSMHPWPESAARSIYSPLALRSLVNSCCTGSGTPASPLAKLRSMTYSA